MTPQIFFGLLGAVIFATLSQSFALSALDKRVYHSSASSSLHDESKNFPLFPDEPDIQGFPEPLAKNETDLDKMETYYRAVADAYKAEASKNEEALRQAHTLQLQSESRTTGAFAPLRGIEKTFKVNSSQPSAVKTLNYQGKARHQHIAYQQDKIKVFQDKSHLYRQKEEFYREVADTNREVRDDLSVDVKPQE